MRLEPGRVFSLTLDLGQRLELALKRDIQLAARTFPRQVKLPWTANQAVVENGDDAAAIPQPDGSYLLLAADGMRADFVAADPWFAGWSAVMVNIADIAAMGGRPWAVVDVLYLGGEDDERIYEGMQAASEAFSVPVVGGHTCRTQGQSVVSAAVLGRAEKIIKSSGARPGDTLLCAVDLRGSFRGPTAFNAATTAHPSKLRSQIELLSLLAQDELVRAGKDISNAGICGTVAMLLEASSVGATVDLEAICAPDGIDPLRWLMAFPSYGYVLSVAPDDTTEVCRRFDALGVACSAIGTITKAPWFQLRQGQDQTTLLDMSSPLTGFRAAPVRWAI